jgi:hypothetical protein
MITKIKANSRKSVANSSLVDAEKSTDEKSFTGMFFFIYLKKKIISHIIMMIII